MLSLLDFGISARVLLFTGGVSYNNLLSTSTMDFSSSNVVTTPLAPNVRSFDTLFGDGSFLIELISKNIGIFTLSFTDCIKRSLHCSTEELHIRKSAPSKVVAFSAAFTVCTLLATTGRITVSDLELIIVLLATIAGRPWSDKTTPLALTAAATSTRSAINK
uniref:Uncharacterized protein n=1 Tax=Opuntia streptacantha TaxID=393608 RepID=A0A7C9EHN7_OPUST